MSINQAEKHHLKTEAQENCLVCGNAGEPIYKDVPDRMEHSMGSWNHLECGHCKSVWLSPRPAADQLSKLYEEVDYYTHHEESYGVAMPILGAVQDELKQGYLQSKFKYALAAKPWQRFFGRLFSVRYNWQAWEDLRILYQPFVPQGRLLEVGCGNGSFLQNLAGLGWQTKGCDLDSKAVEACVAKGLDVTHTGIENAEFEKNSFHAVGSSHVIEHVDDPLLFLSLCKEYLREGGQLTIITPNIGSLNSRVMGKYWIPLDPPRHLFLFSAKSLTMLAEKAGLKNVSISTNLRDTHHVFRESLDALVAEGEAGSFVRFLHKHGRITARLWQLMQWLISSVRRNIGDELILRASKD